MVGSGSGLARDLLRVGPQFPEHRLSMVLMECTLIVTEVAVPDLARESELVLKVGDSTPVTSTCCPRYGPNRNFFVPCS